jgi:hypothetical protein
MALYTAQVAPQDKETRLTVFEALIHLSSRSLNIVYRGDSRINLPLAHSALDLQTPPH